MLGRTIDKARASNAGTLGDYIYDCPMDKALFAALDVGGDEFARVVRAATDDDGVVAGLRSRGALPSGDILERHNAAIDAWAPKSEEGRARFLATREQVAPGRDDIATWTDLLDFEEGRAALRAG
jgi:hypothetical protein